MREMKALIWKEWREQRIVIAIMALCAALLPEVVWAAKDLRLFLSTIAFGMWIIFALMLGAGIFTSDTGARTTEFLLTQPLKERTVWAGKMIFGLFWVVLLCLLSVELMYIKQTANGRIWFGNGEQGEYFFYPPAWFAGILVLFPLTAFLIAALVSNVVTRALEAFLICLIVCGVTVWTVCAFRQELWDLYERFDYRLTGFALVPLALGLGLGGYLAFSILPRPAWRRAVVADLGLCAVLAGGLLVLSGVTALTERAPSLCMFLRLRNVGYPGWDNIVQPGGRMVAVCAESEWWSPRVWLVNTDGSGFKKISRGFASLSVVPPYCPWSADGRYLVYTSAASLSHPLFRSDEAHVIRYDCATGNSLVLPVASRDGDQYYRTVAGFPGKDRRIFYYLGGRMGLYDAGPTPVESSTGPVLATGWAHLDRLLPGREGDLGWVNLATMQRLDLAPPPEAHLLSISPSGRWFVTQPRMNSPAAQGDVSLWNTKTREATPIARIESLVPASGYWSADVEFSPQERFLALHHSGAGKKSGSFLLYDLSMNRPVVQRTGLGHVLSPCFSPDDCWIAYATAESARPTSGMPFPPWRLRNLDDGKETPLRDAIYSDVRWSPDSKRLSYSAVPYPYAEKAKFIVFDMDTKTRRELHIPARYIRSHQWLDNDRILLVLGTHDHSALWVVRADGTGLKRLFP